MIESTMIAENDSSASAPAASTRIESQSSTVCGRACTMFS